MTNPSDQLTKLREESPSEILRAWHAGTRPVPIQFMRLSFQHMLELATFFDQHTAAILSLAEALAAGAEEAREDGIRSVLLIRCTKHLTIGQQNTNEITGAECGGCIAAERDSLTSRLAAAEKQRDEAVEFLNRYLAGAPIGGWRHECKETLQRIAAMGEGQLSNRITS